MKTKKCNGILCQGNQQNIILFSKNKNSKDGLTHMCKICKKEYDALYRKKNKIKLSKKNIAYKSANKDKIKIKDIEYRSNHKYKISLRSAAYRNKNGNKTKIKTRNKKYREDNKEKIAQQKKTWANKNKERVRANHKRWRDLNPSKVIKNRAAKHNIKESYTAADKLITLTEFNNRCFNCGSIENLHIDHHRPLSKGNSLTLQNAVILCRSCNSSKRAKDPEDFYGTKKCDLLDEKLKKIAQLHNKK